MNNEDNILDLITDRLKAGMSEVAEHHCELTREAISVPYPPASSPGNPPHLRTGNLASGIAHSQTADEEYITETFTFDRPGGDPHVPTYLEEGTPNMAERPYVKPMIDRMEATFLEELVAIAQF